MDDLNNKQIAAVSGGVVRAQSKSYWQAPKGPIRHADRGFTQPVPFPAFRR
ncbi:hypothetical protein [Glaciecola sp. SC05]|uniref:hypothetical protein n=1 Tax=Glaciecola sp. SC05 TaxID=1987355 RepID=UPI003528621A